MNNKIKFMLLILLSITTINCSKSYMLGSKSNDKHHSLTITKAILTDSVEQEFSGKNNAFLIVQYKIKNLQKKNDIKRDYSQQFNIKSMMITSAKEKKNISKDKIFKPKQDKPVNVASFKKQLWEASLSANEKKEGYIVFKVPVKKQDKKASDSSAVSKVKKETNPESVKKSNTKKKKTDIEFTFNLKFVFPESKKKVVYRFTAFDYRSDSLVEWILIKLKQKENVSKVPLLKGTSTFFPIRLYGRVIVKTDKILKIINMTKGLKNDEQKKSVIKNYILKEIKYKF